MTRTSKIGRIAEILSDNKLSNYENVAEIIKDRSVVTQNEIQEATSLSKGAVSQILKALRDEGLVINIKEKRGRQSLYKWVGGTSTIEDELQRATEKHVSASLLAETYDSLVTDAFALFSVLFDGSGWEVIANFREGLTDTELHQSIGNDIPLDSIRRILVISDAHNLITINRIRSSAGTTITKLFEPLYRINSVNKELLNSLILIRGLASAIRFESDGSHIAGHQHPFSAILDLNKRIYSLYLNCTIASAVNEEEELIFQILSKGYDFVPDLDRLNRSGSWRDNMKNSKIIARDETTDSILFESGFAKSCQKKIIKKLGDTNE